MADLDDDIRDALKQIRIHGSQSLKGSDAWVTMARIVRHIAISGTGESARVDPDDVSASMMVLLQSPSIRRRIGTARFPAAYLRGMARYVRIEQLRRCEKTVSLETTVPVIATTEAHELRESDHPADVAVRRLQSAVAALSPAERMLVHQRFWEGLSIADIARGLAEPYSRVAVRLFRLTRKLRRAIESS